MPVGQTLRAGASAARIGVFRAGTSSAKNDVMVTTVGGGAEGGVERNVNEYLRELAENVHEVFWIADPGSTRILYVSPGYERMFGRRCEELYEKPRSWLDSVHLADRERMLAVAEAQIAVEQCHLCRVIRAGAIRSIQVKIAPIRDPAGVVVRIAGICVDVTERLQLEEEVRQTQKLESLGLLAGGVAHDFNNILAVIASNVSLLATAIPPTHPDFEIVDEIERAVFRATGLTRQLLAFSRKQPSEPVVLDLNAAIGETRKMLRRMVGEDVIITTSLEPELAHIRIDPGALVQILMNLAVNARDAMPGGGTLSISTRIESGRVVLAVSDTGCGMPPEVQARAFEPLFTTKGLGKGTGLGLSIVRRIVEQAGGEIELESALGVGTTFRFRFPPAVAKADVSGRMPVMPVHGKETVLVVDDDAHVRHAIARSLRACGYGVVEAGDGCVALELLRHNQAIELLVTDIVMPNMNGCQLASEARAQRPGLQVLFMSGYADDVVPRDGVSATDVVLEKPFRNHTLANRIRKMLDSRSRMTRSGRIPSFAP
jgi:two-component system, cell cycle sensor histidine kinase and response regulator CckA